MQLGTRWPLGGDPAARVPDPMRAAIRSVEAELAESDVPTAGWAWTLTYLEGEPVVELDDGTRIRMTSDDVALVTSTDLDEDAALD